MIEVRNRTLCINTILDGKYRIDSVLGEGGFGITYIGTQLHTEQKVAIKEYFPFGMVSRENSVVDQSVYVFQGEKGDYERGMQRFLKEAQILRDYQYLDGIVSVMDCFTCNQTAYIVMEYIEGITLKRYIEENGCLSYNELIQLLEPVMKSLIQIHRQGLIHRDISSDNLIIGLDNKARLIDFGAADLIDDRNKKAMTVILKSGYAPPEQYLTEGKQGPWTDVYAFCAMMYMALTGRTPTEALERLQGKEIDFSMLSKGILTDWQMEGLKQGLEMRISDRFKNLEELLYAMKVPPSREDIPTVKKAELSRSVKRQLKILNKTQMKVNVFMILGISLVLIMAVEVILNGDYIVKQFAKNRERTDAIVVNTTASTELYAQSDDDVIEDAKKEKDNGSLQVFQSQVDNNYVISSNPMPMMKTIPLLVGLEENAAIETISKMDSDIVVNCVYEYSDYVPKDSVISQSVAAQVRYNAGTIKEMILSVSKGKYIKPAVSIKTNSVEATTQEKKKKKKIQEYEFGEEEEEYDTIEW